MSREVFIEKNEKGFWIPEAFMEVLSQYVCEVFESRGINTFSQNLQDIYYECHYNRTGENIGVVNILLDKYVTNKNDKNALIHVLEQTKVLVVSKGAELSILTLNEFESNKVDHYFKVEWHYPIQTQSLVATINIME